MNALAILHIAKKQLGLDDNTWRDLLERETGKRSSKDMSDGERGRVLDVLKSQGFKPASRSSRKGLEGKYAGKLQALWIAGWNLGLMRENGADAALLAFVKRQTGIDHTRFLRYHDDATKAIEALKAWLARDGGVDWSESRFLPEWTQTNGYRIAKAQQRMISAFGPGAIFELHKMLGDNGFDNAATITDTGWIDVMNKMGAMIRSRKGSV
jgi:CRISPR/Cas system CMR-associated protein Cmr5 small subunit